MGFLVHTGEMGFLVHTGEKGFLVHTGEKGFLGHTGEVGFLVHTGEMSFLVHTGEVSSMYTLESVFDEICPTKAPFQMGQAIQTLHPVYQSLQEKTGKKAMTPEKTLRLPR
ncbi:hypothetical protein STEG23_003385, partial [Scotinomys teguina]